MDIQLMVFDHDMTIVDSSYAIMAGFNAVADEVGRPRVDHDRVMRYIATPLPEFCEGLLGEYRPEWGERYGVHVRGFERTLIRPYPETIPTMTRLRELGVKLAVVSNREDPRSAMERVGLDGYFDAIVGAAAPYGPLPYKPDPAMLNALLADLGVPRERTIYVGDDKLDIETARGAGIRGVGITQGNFTAGQFRELGAWRVIAALDELVPLAEEGIAR